MYFEAFCFKDNTPKNRDTFFLLYLLFYQILKIKYLRSAKSNKFGESRDNSYSNTNLFTI